MTPRAGSSAYIQNGRITRSSSSSHQLATQKYKVSIVRLLVSAVVLATLIVTNPSNGCCCSHWIPQQYWHVTEKQSGFWSAVLPPQDTNFGLFALSRTIDGVSVTGLLNTVEVCKFDSPEEDELLNLMCGWVDDTFCHGKPLLDWNDLPFTVNRLLCWVVMASMLSPFIIQRTSPRKTTPFTTITSILQQPTIWDLIRINLVVYPALVSMDRLMRSCLVVDGYTWRFLTAFFILVFVIGGLCNQVASSFQQYQLVGMGSAFAACLAYHKALSSKSLFQFVQHSFSTSTIFWLDAIMLLLSNRIGELVAWVGGGFAGHAFAQVHQQWLAEALRSNIKSSIHKTVGQFVNLFH